MPSIVITCSPGMQHETKFYIERCQYLTNKMFNNDTQVKNISVIKLRYGNYLNKCKVYLVHR